MNKWIEKKIEDVVEIDREQLKGIYDSNYQFYYIDISSVSSGKIQFPMFPISLKDAPSRARKVLNDQDILMSTVRPNLKSFAQFHSPDKNSKFVASTGFAVLSKKERTDLTYIYHCLFSDSLEKQIDSLVVGSNYPAINTRDVRELRVLIPTCEREQAQIAAVLSCIDRALEQTEAIIAKQQRIKAGLMQDLLTKGIDEHGNIRDEATHEFKDSPLGRIPKEWEVLGLKDKEGVGKSYIRTGPFGSSLKGEHWVKEGVPVVTIGSLGEGEFIIPELFYITESKAQSLKSYALESGDIVFSRVADVGRAVVVTEAEQGWVMSSNLMRISLNLKKVNSFFTYLIIAHSDRTRAQIRKLINAGGRELANSDVISRIRFAWAPIDEQNQIVKMAKAIDGRIRLEEKALFKLQKLKTGLMQDLLTGKVRVNALLEAKA